MFNYDEICRQKVWPKIKTETPELELINLLHWHFTTPSKLSEKIKQHAGIFAGKLWALCTPLEKQKIAAFIVANSYQDPNLFAYFMGLNLFKAQFIYEKKVNECLNEAKSIGSGHITRIIAINAKYINDDEVNDALFLYLNKHGFENCCVVTSQALLEANLNHPDLSTIVCLGHGFLRDREMIYDCGPIEGTHDIVVKSWAKLLQKAPQVKHVRLLYCFYGQVNPDFDEEKQDSDIQYNHDKYAINSGRVTATVTYRAQAPLPFHPESFAGMLWNQIVIKDKRNNFCLSATPLILNPLPAKKPEFFAACDVDHYNMPIELARHGMWRQANLPLLAKTKAIRLITPDSEKSLSK